MVVRNFAVDRFRPVALIFQKRYVIVGLTGAKSVLTFESYLLKRHHQR